MMLLEMQPLTVVKVAAAPLCEPMITARALAAEARTPTSAAAVLVMVADVRRRSFSRLGFGVKGEIFGA